MQQQYSLSIFHYYCCLSSLGAREAAKQPVPFLWAIYIFIQVFRCGARNARLASRLSLFNALVLIHGSALLACCLLFILCDKNSCCRCPK